MNELYEQEHERDLQRLRGLRPMDDDFMRCLFKDNLPLAQMVLRIMTGIKDLVLIKEETQRDMKRLVGARSICLDVYGIDSNNKRYDLEVQRADRGARPKRARYHSSAMDIESLNANQAFEDLPETYTIFVTENDVFETGEAVYPIERMNMSTGMPFDDGEHILYINGQYSGDDDLGRLMHDFRCSDPDDMIFDNLAEKTRFFKQDPRGVNYMCKIMEDMRNEAAEFSREETIINNVKSLMESVKWTAQQAMDALKIPVDEQSKYLSKL